MKVVFTFLAVLLSAFVFANNIQLQKVSLTDTNRTAKTVNIKMNISWEHSWRDSINWDAAWIIIKYKEPKDSVWKWKHAQLSLAGNDIGTGTAAMKIVVPNDLGGAFFYRSSISSGNVANNNVKLLWNYGTAGVTNIDSVEVRVFATEMVYVPQGSFCLGDGNGTTRGPNAFQLKNAPNNYAIVNDKWSSLINTGFTNDDAAVMNNGIRISGLQGLDINDDKVSDYSNFPTGFKGFYSMKYKVTQGQYTDFLNTVCTTDTTASLLNSYINSSSAVYPDNNPVNMPSVSRPLIGVWQRLANYMTSAPTDLQRHTITFDIVQSKFIVSRPDRAYSLMNIDKAFSFAEWFGLRPPSELEFEKECRGPLPPMLGEAAYGNDANIPANTAVFGLNLTFNGIENGTEYFSNYDITKRFYSSFNGGDGGTGPYRVGIYANDTSSRVSAMASYYGIMDLSRITSEIVVPLSINANRSFSSLINGKGILSPFGGDSYSFNSNAGIGSGSSSIPANFIRRGSVSIRGNSLGVTNGQGFRAVRSAPSDN